MRKMILLSLALLIVAAPAFALVPTKTETANFIVYRFASADTLAANTADTWTFQIDPSFFPIISNDDDASTNYSAIKAMFVNATSTAAADSIHFGLDTGISASGPWVAVVDDGSETFHENGGVASILEIDNAIGTWWRVRVLNRKASAITPVGYICLPKLPCVGP